MLFFALWEKPEDHDVRHLEEQHRLLTQLFVFFEASKKKKQKDL